MPVSKFLLIILYFILLSSLSAQPRFEHFDVNNGLTHNNIQDLVIDDQGYVWVATFDQLVRYNGFGFEQLSTSGKITGFPDFTINRMAKAPNGDIWFGSRYGDLSCYSSDLQRFKTYPNIALENPNLTGVKEICVTGEEQVWLFRHKTIHASFYKEQIFSDTTLNEITGICPYAANSILSYGLSGLRQVSINSSGEFQIIEKFRFQVYKVIKQQTDFLAITHTGIITIDSSLTVSDTLIHFNEVNPEHIPDFSLVSSLIKDNNDVWVGTEKGLFHYKLQKDSIHSEKLLSDPYNPYAINGNIIKGLNIDQVGNLWVSTFRSGIGLMNRKRNLFKHINWKSTKPDLKIYALYKSRDQRIWLGFDDYGAGVIHPDHSQKFYTTYYLKNGDSAGINLVRSIFEDSKGNLWLGTESTLCLYNKERDRFEAANIKYDWEWPFSCHIIHEYKPGVLIVNNLGNIASIAIETGKISFFPKRKNGVRISEPNKDLAFDNQGNLWVTKNQRGLIKISFSENDTIYQAYTAQSNGFKDNTIYEIEIENDTLYVCSHKGLSIFDIKGDSLIANFDERDGLSNNIIYSVKKVNNHLWMSTNRGISVLDPSTRLTKTYLESFQFIGGADFFSQENELYYGGGSTSFVVFHPEKLVDLVYPVHPFLESFYLFNEKIEVNDSINGNLILSKTLNNTAKIELDYQQHSFSFQFNAFPFDFPNTNRFRYRLVNLHEDWIYPTAENRVASYNYVPYGDYRFELSVSNTKGNWSEPLAVDISISPPFWETTWFKFLVIFSVTLLPFVFYRLRILQIKNRNQLLKRKVEEQTFELSKQNREIQEMAEKVHESDQEKLRIFTNVSHEFRTPLTLILGYLDKIPNSSSDASSKQVIKNNAKRLLRLVNQLIDIRKLDHGKMQLNITEIKLVRFIEDIIMSFKVLSEQKNISIRFDSDVQNYRVWLDSDKLETILYNLISNAIKYTKPNHSILVILSVQVKTFQIQVIDQGIGISKAELDQIFSRFFRSEGNNAISGHGIGLALVKGLTEIQQGKIEVESEKGVGTTFTLSFKVGKDHFKSSDFGTPQLLRESEMEKIATDIHILPRFSGEKILLVEDNRELTNFILDLLTPFYEVKTTANGEEAFLALQHFTPALIISDVMMPKMDGMEFCKRVKAQIATSHIPFIFLTAKTVIEYKIEGFQQGIDAYIEKPFNPQLLLVRIQALLDSRKNLISKFQQSHLFSESIKDEVAISETDKAFLQKIDQLISENYNQPDFSAEKLFKLVNMSRTGFYTKFKALTGTNAGSHLRKYRLTMAAKLLKETDLQIVQICDKVGFLSQQQFRTGFKEQFGKNPVEYRKR